MCPLSLGNLRVPEIGVPKVVAHRVVDRRTLKGEAPWAYVLELSLAGEPPRCWTSVEVVRDGSTWVLAAKYSSRPLPGRPEVERTMYAATRAIQGH